MSVGREGLRRGTKGKGPLDQGDGDVDERHLATLILLSKEATDSNRAGEDMERKNYLV